MSKFIKSEAPQIENRDYFSVKSGAEPRTESHQLKYLCFKTNVWRFLVRGEKGFSLAEMLTAVAIFAVVVIATASIFIFITNAQEKTKTITKVQQDVRYSLDTIARTIREMKVDYSAYETGSGTECEGIDLNTQPVTTVCFQNEPDDLYILWNGTSLVYGEIPDEHLLTPADIEILDFAVYLTPPESPYYSSGVAQGFATIVIRARAASNARFADETVQVQTTVSMRDYSRQIN